MPKSSKAKGAVAAGAAVTGLAAGVAYFVMRRRRSGSPGLLEEQVLLGVAPVGETRSREKGSELPAGVEVDGPEHLTEKVADLARMPSEPV